jgi:hypothetical protein
MKLHIILHHTVKKKNEIMKINYFQDPDFSSTKYIFHKIYDDGNRGSVLKQIYYVVS